MADVLPDDAVRFFSYVYESERLHQQTFDGLKAARHLLDALQYGQGADFRRGDHQMHDGTRALPAHCD
eukprot:5906992-Pyramimonas_sp.AAC.1